MTTSTEQPRLEYHLLHRRERWSWWRPLGGVVTLGVLVLLVAQLVLVVGFTVGFAVAGRDVGSGLEQMVDTSRVTPLSLAYLNLALAAAIPATMVVQRLFHGQTPGWLSSVVPRIRWRWMLTCFGLAFLALLATLVVAAFLPAQSDGGEVGGSVNDFTRTTRDFLLVIVLLTPLQAAGEEYAFRGYLTQAFGGLFRSRWAAVLFPAVLFALAHGAQDPPIFVDRLAFGLVAGVLVIATGGLEAGIAMHVLNNFLAYGLALAYSDMSSALNPTGGTWASLPVTLTQSLSYTALAIWAVRRQGVRTTAEPRILESPNSRV